MDIERHFRDAVRENSRRISGICSYFFSDHDDCHDAYQESLIRIWQNLRSFRGDSLLSTWIYRVVVNTCLVHKRSDQRRKNLIANALPADACLIAETSGDGDTGYADRKVAFLRRFIGGLIAADRTLVALYLETFSTKEMAEITGLSEANVRVRIHRIKEKIKNEWEEQQHGTGRF